MKRRTNIQLSLDEGLEVARDVQPDRSSLALAHVLGVPKAYLLRRSVDARKKSDVHFVVTAGVGGGKDAPRAIVSLEKRPLPQPQQTYAFQPLVVGMGPAGLFAALELAEAGLCPLVIERGAPVDERKIDIARYHATRVLDIASNVQFGEGGAGTFSDGKLNTGKHSPLIAQVLETFVAAGAPTEILWQAKPHIGTDILGDVVARIRKRIIACGGKVSFHTQLVDIVSDTNCCEGFMPRDVCVVLSDGKTIKTNALVLACGHSARDTFVMLSERGLELEPKPFAIGVRIEHLQKAIDRAQYGQAAGHPALQAADYKLVAHLDNARSVYSFCMCPGGEVVAASSEEGCLTVNGMSRQARDGDNANAALLVNVTTSDYDDPFDPLAGIAFQRHWEQAAYMAGGGNWRAPIERVGAFLAGPKTTGRCKIVRYQTARKTPAPQPSYPLGVEEVDLQSCLPTYVVSSLREALVLFGQRIHGFDDPGALLTGVETRSSSPVRIVRDAKTLQSTRISGVYPCGEGAGYAGGIMSAALDGIKVARRIIAAS